MTFLDKASKLLAKEAKGLARTQIRGLVNKKAKSLLSNFFSKSQEQLQAEVQETLGFPSLHWKQNKSGEIEFKSSPLFMQEFLTMTPDLQGRLVKDEETNKIYYDDELLGNAAKIDLINLYCERTKINSAAVNSHFENALKLLSAVDYTSIKFAEEFVGWDKSPIIHDWLANVFGKESIDCEYEYAAGLFRKWIIGAAHRILNPGASFQGTLVLVGPPGSGKTLHFRNLLPEPFSDRCGEIVCKSIKDPAKLTEAIVGKSIASFDEMSMLDETRITETLKQLLTLQQIQTRLAWGRSPITYNLRQAFCGTTNQSKFIQDAALLRRLWIIPLNEQVKFNYDYLMDNRRALWQEAVHLNSEKASFFLNSEEQKEVEKFNQRFSKN
jgi:hypothetical protein